MNNQEKILEIIEEQQRKFLGSNEANLHASEEIAEQFRPKLKQSELEKVYTLLFKGEISFSKATQILNGDEEIIDDYNEKGESFFNDID